MFRILRNLLFTSRSPAGYVGIRASRKWYKLPLAVIYEIRTKDGSYVGQTSNFANRFGKEYGHVRQARAGRHPQKWLEPFLVSGRYSVYILDWPSTYTGPDDDLTEILVRRERWFIENGACRNRSVSTKKPALSDEDVARMTKEVKALRKIREAVGT